MFSYVCFRLPTTCFLLLLLLLLRKVVNHYSTIKRRRTKLHLIGRRIRKIKRNIQYCMMHSLHPHGRRSPSQCFLLRLLLHLIGRRIKQIKINIQFCIMRLFHPPGKRIPRTTSHQNYGLYYFNIYII